MVTPYEERLVDVAFDIVKFGKKRREVSYARFTALPLHCAQGDYTGEAEASGVNLTGHALGYGVPVRDGTAFFSGDGPDTGTSSPNPIPPTYEWHSTIRIDFVSKKKAKVTVREDVIDLGGPIPGLENYWCPDPTSGKLVFKAKPLR